MYRLRFFQNLIKTRHLFENKLNYVAVKSALTQDLSYSKLKHARLNHNLANKNVTNLSEKEFVAQLKNDPDIFGGRLEEKILDEGDIAEEKHFTEQVHPSKRLSTKQYADLIKGHLRKRKIKEALDVLEVKMLKEDKVKPESYIYNLLLGGCGRVGYTKKAFHLYNDMKKRGLKVTEGTYTALFNACANSPWPQTDGLSRAKHLQEIMIEKQYNPNDTNYNAMIKAFGRCGDIPTAFNLVDEMITKQMPIKIDTINFLIQACITDKEAGFRHALLVWRKLVNKRIKPDIYTYNLMLRSIKDCGLGDLETTTDVIKKIVSEGESKMNSVRQIEDKETIPLLNTNINEKSNEQLTVQVVDNTNKLPAHKETSLRPNLMANTPYLGNIISLSEVLKPEDRLLLVGGFPGFIKSMEDHKCSPDLKTFTQLLLAIPGTLSAENELLAVIKKMKVKPDIDFYNMLIKKRSMRCDYAGAKDVLKLIDRINYYPDLVTYGVLAIGCQTREEAVELIMTIKDAGFRLNSEILGAMLHQACYIFNYQYVFEIMETALRENVSINKQFLQHLNKFYNFCKEKSNTQTLTKAQERQYTIFKKRYKNWLNEIQIDKNEEAHPWQQYRQKTVGNEKYFKTKDTARFKPKHNSMFKVKTSPKHKE
ncbi:unnamed protein product [Brassicogethes aeneus]|uniref:Pentatricopeptide repeat-containing protein 1 n=1 Tax=Brassicogethes aeneus TaxID=1431903 RepID=A0A9P0FA41_BRAAE|nr:unnamed protein product [Brassicogethes aeneus]